MRLDKFLFEKKFFQSRNKASEAINRGEVFVNGIIADKSSVTVTDKDNISTLTGTISYVSLGGYKLQRALETFEPLVYDKVFIDVGASTGGFTDCLLQNKAKKVYCVDVGENQLAQEILNNPKVVVMDKTNARYLTRADFQETVDGIVVDCSFISLEYILPPLINLIKDDGFILALIKPQFETERKSKMKNGILRSEQERRRIIEKIYFFVESLGLYFKNICLATSDIKKNKEYIAYITKKAPSKSIEDICSKI